MSRRDVFIAGTDTDVGKTWVVTRLIRHFRKQRIDAVGIKPVECGGPEDSRLIFEACQDSGITAAEVNPVAFPDPLAPAAMDGGDAIDLDRIGTAFRELQKRHEMVIAEGAGGWLVPLDDSRTMADLAVALAVPVIVVAANRLGVLNHTLLTARAIESSGLRCAGIYLNEYDGVRDHSSRSNAEVLRSHLPHIPVINSNIADLAGLL
jgi:dethiobiotin synthetase